MSNEYSAAICGFIVGILIGVYIGATFSEAEAHIPEVPMLSYNGLEEIVHTLGHILVEEKVQTALLDQINCYSAYEWKEGWYPNQLVNKFRMCGQPLNYTGVWTP